MDRYRFLNQTTAKNFENVLFELPSGQKKAIDDVTKAMLSVSIPLAEKRKNAKAFFRSVESMITEKIKDLSQSEQNIFRRSLIAKLALELQNIIDQMRLPESILKLYPHAFDRLLDHLIKNKSDTYNLSNDYFRKDIAFVLGVSVPCGAQVVDLKSYFLFRSIARALSRPGNVKAIIHLLRVKGTGPWFRIHTETRYLDEFSEPGWDACYIRIADLLERKPSIRGMIGTSWFYDPQLLSISPRLAYLQKRPLERGAFMIRHGTSTFDIEKSTSKSKTRRALYKEGKYLPVCHSLLWPRKKLISWAKSLN